MCTIVQIVNSQKSIYKKGDPNLTFTSCPNRKSKLNIFKISYFNNRKRYIHNFCTIVQIVNSQKNIYKKVTPIRPLLPVQTGSQNLILKQSYLNNHKRYISNCWTIVQIVNCQKILITKWPNLTFTSCPNRKSKLNIFKISYLNNRKR